MASWNDGRKNRDIQSTKSPAQFTVVRGFDNLMLNGRGGFASLFDCDVWPACSPRFKRSPTFRFSPNADFVSSRDRDFETPNYGHTNSDGWVNNQDSYVSEYPPLVAGDSFVECADIPQAVGKII